MLKRIVRSPQVTSAVGWVAARYFGLVRRTNRIAVEPPDFYDAIAPDVPVIGAMWHGQHFMAPYARRPGDRVASLVSKSRDGDLNAAVLHHVGIRAIRGSGARGRDPRSKGGAAALRLMLKALADGENVFLTADVPKIARRAGRGIITLAQLSGRPIMPIAVVLSRRVDFASWDQSRLGLPFGRGAMVFGEMIRVPREADEAALAAAQARLDAELDRVHARGYALIDQANPMRPRQNLAAELASLSAEPASSVQSPAVPAPSLD